MARKQQRSKDMDPAQYGFPQYAMPYGYGPSNSHHMPFPLGPYPAFGGMVMNPNGGPFFVHPLAASDDNNVVTQRDDMNGNAEGQRPRRAVKTPTDKINTQSAEKLVSEAAHELNKRSKHSIRIYQDLQTQYKDEVKSIEKYAGNDILQEIWKKKVAQFQKTKAKDAPGQRLSDQHDLLTGCLDKMDDAAQHLHNRLSPSRHQYDMRKTLLDKIQQAGDRVREFSSQASTNKDAHNELVVELESIAKLTDAKSSILYHPEKSEDDSQDQENPQDGNSWGQT